MKLVFLDIDGVLNSGDYIKWCDGAFDDPLNQMDSRAVARINKITDATGAKIVVSSTWRLAFRHQPDSLRLLRNCMACYNITGEVIGMTGVLPGDRRYEIQEWLDMNPGVEQYIILDDGLIEGHSKHFIRTCFESGLQDSDVEIAIKLLNANNYSGSGTRPSE
jgi:hypothetical protein